MHLMSNDAIPVFGLGDRLRKAREHAGLEQGDIATALGIARTSVSNYETGKTHPRQLVLRAWAETCRVSLPWLTDGSHPRKRSSSRAEQRRPRDGGTTIGTGDGTYRSHHRYHHSRQRMMRLALVNRPARQSCSV